MAYNCREEGGNQRRPSCATEGSTRAAHRGEGILLLAGRWWGRHWQEWRSLILLLKDCLQKGHPQASQDPCVPAASLPAHSMDQGAKEGEWAPASGRDSEEWPHQRHHLPWQGSLHQSPRARTSQLLGTNSLGPPRAPSLPETGPAPPCALGLRKEGRFDKSKACVLGPGFVLFWAFWSKVEMEAWCGPLSLKPTSGRRQCLDLQVRLHSRGESQSAAGGTKLRAASPSLVL